ncbi:MAG: MtnX-like HAD-IB family phosphatase [Candidatus Omnitrophica bacterium]|nr:MtnX-like HAD-IB family phosphatase [Candidatus Omnitrophota bacterium]
MEQELVNYRLSDCRVFFDFDNTITVGDVLYELIECYSLSEDWIKLEKAWQLGEITTKQCLIGQMKEVRISRKDLSRYLAAVEIDAYFVKIIELLGKVGVTPVILSDNFEPIIQEIFANNNIRGLPVFANHLEFKGEELIPSFPYSNPDCPFCAHCKKTHFIHDRSIEHPILYVGDGRSDICAAMESDIVFAKDTLLAYLNKHGRDCIEFTALADVYKHLKGKVYEPASAR